MGYVLHHNSGFDGRFCRLNNRKNAVILQQHGRRAANRLDHYFPDILSANQRAAATRDLVEFLKGGDSVKLVEIEVLDAQQLQGALKLCPACISGTFLSFAAEKEALALALQPGVQSLLRQSI